MIEPHVHAIDPLALTCTTCGVSAYAIAKGETLADRIIGKAIKDERESVK